MNEKTTWQDRLKEKLKLAIFKDSWGYEIIETDADGFFKVLNDGISELLKEQRKICAKQYELYSCLTKQYDLYSCLKDSERYIKNRIENASDPKGQPLWADTGEIK
jgi:hypothetical protein